MGQVNVSTVAGSAIIILTVWMGATRKDVIVGIVSSPVIQGSVSRMTLIAMVSGSV